jgi:hypothetical protein
MVYHVARKLDRKVEDPYDKVQGPSLLSKEPRHAGDGPKRRQ